ncbi:MAG: glycoside hydrolase family 3 C-terminal domain-containing protein [Clostridia bacterium]|nr:glycoside hydrolase family 3 C-terminal domain-containing protein [Clostridia bacterium]
MKFKVGQWIQLAVIVVLMVVMIVANNILLDPTLAQNITGLLCPPMVDEEAVAAARAEGQDLSKDIVVEGTVLVKNNGVLPLDYDEASQVNVFGHAAIDWVYGGSGSGQVVPENNSASENIDFLKALEMYNVEYNNQLTALYNDFQSPVGDTGSIGKFYDQFYRLFEPSMSYYPATLLTSAESYSDTAFVVIGRHAGETEDPTRVQYKAGAEGVSIDPSRHYLEISTEEEALLKYVGSKFENVVVIINSTNTMELDFVDTIPGIDACIVVGATGTRAAAAIPYVLYGVDEEGNEVSPSGHFADTYAYDMKSNISYMRTSAQGIGHYTNGQDVYPTGADCNAGVGTRTAPAFIDYVEGIYVGYKWYETADVAGVWANYNREILDENDQKVTVTGYDSVVQYPFGYGLSYTNFDWTVKSISLAEGSEINEKSEITIEVLVENVGEYVGQDVVEVYVTAPYKNTVEKSHVSLVGFVKTNPIAPGASEIVKVTVDAFDFASYDAYGKVNSAHKGYVMEAGEYQLKLMTDSHNVKTVDFTGGAQATEGIITYNVSENLLITNDPANGAKITNKFTSEDAVDGASLDGSDSNQNIGFISRASFPDPASMSKIADREMAANVKEHNEYSKAAAAEWDNATTDIWGNPVSNETVIWGQKSTNWTYNGVDYSGDNGKVYANNEVTKLGLLLGSDYDNPLWEPLLNQITLAEASNVVYSGSFGNAAVGSVGKPELKDYDGPNQVRSFNAGSQRGTGFPCATVVAQTWNPTLAYTFGINYGKEMSALSMDGVYGFGANLHRSAWGGRNYEYFSEDGFLSALMLTQEMRGIKNTGHYGYLKHLVLYETEHERDSMYTWCNEQALREIYLKPFRMCIQEGGCVGIMSSYNRIGNVWTGGSEALITGVIRNEMGFKGMVVTDYVDGWSQGYMAIEDAVRAGGDILLGGKRESLRTGFNASNRIQAQVKEVCHHQLYTFLNARYTNSVYNANEDVDQIIAGSVIESWEWWKVVLVDLNIVVFVGGAFWAYMIVRKAYLMPWLNA